MNYLEMLTQRRDTLIERRDSRLAELDAIAEHIGAESRNATTEEDALFDETREAVTGMNAEIATLDTRISDMAEVARSRATTRPSPAGGRAGSDSPYDIDLRSAPRTAEVRADIDTRARRALDSETRMADNHRESASALLDRDRHGAVARHIIATGRPEYRSAFAKLVTQQNVYLTEAEGRAIEEVRALQITTDASGGYLMPFTLDPTIILTNAGTINPIRQLATVRTTLTDNWQGVTSAGVTASWDAESEEVSDDTPPLAQPSIPVRTPRAFVPFTVEAEDDFASLAADVSTMLFDAKERLEAAGFTTGTGASNQPTGLITGLVAASSITTSTTTDVFAVGDVYKVQDALPARYESGNVSWLSNKLVMSMIRQFGTADSHALLTRLSEANPVGIMGAPWFSVSDMDGVINAAAENYIMVYGDIGQAYRINDRIGMSIELVPHLFGVNRRPTGERGWFARWRVGAGIVNGAAARVLNIT